MENATYIALSRLDAEQRAMSVVANNIANAATTGFKGEQTLFSDFLVPQGDQAHAYTQDRATFRNTAQGEFQQTGNPLDLAIGGNGYFQVQTDRGVRLTRAGRFERLTDGTITDASGHPVLNRGGNPLMVRPSDRQVTVASDGTIQTESGPAGQIAIVMPEDENHLHQEGGQLLRSDTPAQLVQHPDILQGTLEASNVKPMMEMTRMLDIQRSFQFMSQFVQSEATRQQDAISKIVQEQS